MHRKSTEELLSIIDALATALDENTLNGIKFLLLSQDIDELRHQIHSDVAKSHDLKELELRMTIRLGLMVTAGVGILAALFKLL